MRRLRRRSAAVNQLYCRTNGCASFLHLDPATGIATCSICGYRRAAAGAERHYASIA
jgi:hypothetical protein